MSDAQVRTMDVDAACAAQKKYQRDKGYPDFAPSNGTCWKCHKNIYQDYEQTKGYSVERAGNELITGCPHCYKSYCD